MKPRTYYPHVEGLRGIAALYVFVFHVWQTGIADAGATLRVLLPATVPWLQFGHYAVSAFIVISGYCLGLPVAQKPEAAFDARRFARRRARRLGPAYVLALALSVAPFLVAASLLGKHPPLWHVGAALAAHLLLVHNLIPPLAEYLNGPMWSIALECQIYVVFALLLVPVWKRAGRWAQLALALVVGLAPHVFLHGRADYTMWWLLALFAMGVVAADVTARGGLHGRAWRAVALLAAGAALIAILRHGQGAPDDALWAPDLVVGVAVALLFATSSDDRPPLTARLLALRPIVFLGTFSYSLYLVHGPPVILAGAWLGHIHAGVAASALLYAGLIPAVVAFAYGFSLLAERPFLSPAFRAAIERADRAAAVDGTAEEPAVAFGVLSGG